MVKGGRRFGWSGPSPDEDTPCNYLRFFLLPKPPDSPTPSGGSTTCAVGSWTTRYSLKRDVLYLDCSGRDVEDVGFVSVRVVGRTRSLGAAVPLRRGTSPSDPFPVPSTRL